MIESEFNQILSRLLRLLILSDRRLPGVIAMCERTYTETDAGPARLSPGGGSTRTGIVFYHPAVFGGEGGKGLQVPPVGASVTLHPPKLLTLAQLFMTLVMKPFHAPLHVQTPPGRRGRFSASLIARIRSGFEILFFRF